MVAANNESRPQNKIYLKTEQVVNECMLIGKSRPQDKIYDRNQKFDYRIWDNSLKLQPKLSLSLILRKIQEQENDKDNARL